MLGDDIEIVTGVNLPMLIKLSTIRSNRWGTATTIQEHGRKNILVAGAFLRGEEQIMTPFYRVDNRLVHGQIISTRCSTRI